MRAGRMPNKELCARLGIVPSTLARYLTCERKVPNHFLIAVAECLGITADEREQLFVACHMDRFSRIRSEFREEVRKHDEGKRTGN